MKLPRHTLWRAAALAAALLVLAAVFTAYLSPNFAFGLATQLWNCF